MRLKKSQILRIVKHDESIERIYNDYDLEGGGSGCSKHGLSQVPQVEISVACVVEKQIMGQVI